MEGVSKGEADSANHTVIVTFDDTRTSVEDIQQALAKGGYPPEGEPRLVSDDAARQSKDTVKVLVGQLSKEQLYSEMPIFAEHDRSYSPQQALIADIKKIDSKVDLVMFVGTWCPDSQKEAPKILKILEVANNPNLSITIYGLDRDKKDPQGLAQEHKIQKVPTTIFFRDGKELGRIVEYPQKSPEEDFLDIVGS